MAIIDATYGKKIAALKASLPFIFLLSAHASPREASRVSTTVHTTYRSVSQNEDLNTRSRNIDLKLASPAKVIALKPSQSITESTSVKRTGKRMKIAKPMKFGAMKE